MDKNIIDLLPSDSFNKLKDESQKKVLDNLADQNQATAKGSVIVNVFCIVLLITSLIYTPFIIKDWWHRLFEPYNVSSELGMYLAQKIIPLFWIFMNLFIIYSARLLFTGKGYIRLTDESVGDPENLVGFTAQIYGFLLLFFGLLGYYFLVVKTYTELILK